jgi:hypothetical protein
MTQRGDQLRLQLIVVYMGINYDDHNWKLDWSKLTGLVISFCVEGTCHFYKLLVMCPKGCSSFWTVLANCCPHVVTAIEQKPWYSALGKPL